MTTADVQAEILRADLEATRRRAASLGSLLAESDRLLWAIEALNLKVLPGRACIPNPSPLLPPELHERVVALVDRAGMERDRLERANAALDAVFDVQEEVFASRRLALRVVLGEEEESA